MNILGINAYHGDSAACLVADGKLVCAVEEERIRRVKHWAGLPSESVRFCLDYAGLKLAEVDHLAVGRDPTAHARNEILTSLKARPSLAKLRRRFADLGRVRELVAELARALDEDPARVTARVHGVEHHRAHMASSFFLSPFDDAACLTIDGFGDAVSTTFGNGNGNRIAVDRSVRFPHSLGLFYTACTQYLGFPDYGDEYKVMGLAPYGEPEYLDAMREIMVLTPDGGFEMNLDYFRHQANGFEMQWQGGRPELQRVFADTWIQRFGPAREAGQSIEQRHKDLARSLQAMAEEVYFHILDHLAVSQPTRRLCLAGGCAYNCVANGKIFDRTPYTDVHIHPAAGDAGTAVGAAYWVWHQGLGRPRDFQPEQTYLGPGYDDGQVRAALASNALQYEWIEDPDELTARTAERIEAGDVVGWFQGRSEWGPRALGNRSIVVDPRRLDAKDTLNRRVKRRESFRPFAASVLEERAGEYFECGYPSPFMSRVYTIRRDKRAGLPAVCHVDGTARLQTVGRRSNPLFHKLLSAFAARTGTPLVLNTSFNENEPLVHRPQEAIDCFNRTRMDTLVVGKALLRKPG